MAEREKPIESLAVSARYVVINGADAGREGVLIDVLEMEELFGGWREWLRACLTLRPRRRWQASWLTLEFDDGTQGAYRRDELEARHAK